MTRTAFLLLLPILLVLGGCTVGSQETQIPKKVQKKADLLYGFGMKLLKKGNAEEARAVFKKVRSGFPISMYATLAELRIADTHMKEEHFATAAAAYRDYYKDHPNNEMVLTGYVMYMIGYCNFRLGPGNFFLFPPDHEKDLSYVQNAYLIFKVFFQKYPKSVYMKKARKYYERSLSKLSRHEMYVAKYYLKRKKPKGAKLRLDYLVSKYPDSKLAPGAALLLSELHIKDGEYARAGAVLKTVLKRYAGTPQAREALAALAQLKGRKEK